MNPKKFIPVMAILTSLIFANYRSQDIAIPVPVTAIISPPINTMTPVKATPSSFGIPTQIPISTFSPEEALETFVNIIEKDGECNLPCWLNVRIGQTSFEEVKRNFLQFSAIASTKFSPQSAYIRVFFPNFETAIHSTATEVYHGSGGEVSHIWVNAGVHPDVNGNMPYSNPAFQKVWH